jgi:hypothetical protein
MGVDSGLLPRRDHGLQDSHAFVLEEEAMVCRGRDQRIQLV